MKTTKKYSVGGYVHNIVSPVVAIGAALLFSASMSAAQDKEVTDVYSPTGTVPNLAVYYPGTEALGPDEMRVVALGTGQPSPRPKQAAACFGRGEG